MKLKHNIHLLSIALAVFSLIYLPESVHSQPADTPLIYLEADELPRFESDSSLSQYIHARAEWPQYFDGSDEILLSFVISATGMVENLHIEIRNVQRVRK